MEPTQSSWGTSIALAARILAVFGIVVTGMGSACSRSPLLAARQDAGSIGAGGAGGEATSVPQESGGQTGSGYGGSRLVGLGGAGGTRSSATSGPSATGGIFSTTPTGGAGGGWAPGGSQDAGSVKTDARGDAGLGVSGCLLSGLGSLFVPACCP